MVYIRYCDTLFLLQFLTLLIITQSFTNNSTQSVSSTAPNANSTAQCFYAISNDNTSILLKVCPTATNEAYSIGLYGNDDPNMSIFSSFGTSTDMDAIWVLLCGAIVFFMQSGFTLLEAGMVKHTNVQNILFKNVMDACIGSITFYLFGYCLAYGDDSSSHSNGFIGVSNVALQSSDWNSFFFQWAFAATAATIVSGSVAERCRLDAYFVYTLMLTLWVYPCVVHWMWSNTGWLSPFNSDISAIDGGIIDFAGSGVVHMVGGFSGLIGAFFLGPRLNRFDGEIAVGLQYTFTYGHSVPYQVLGTLILWFGWYGFNPGSTLAAQDSMELASRVAVITTLSASSGGITVAIMGKVLDAKVWMVPAVCNGILAGLVSITAPCAVVKPWAAVCIGFIGGVFYWMSSFTLANLLHIDDPLDAFSVHGVCGAWGLISVGVFAYDKQYIIDAYGEGALADLGQGYRFAIQFMAAVVIASWTVVNGIIIFGGLKLAKRLRITEEEEKQGLDTAEMGGSAYNVNRVYTLTRGQNVSEVKPMMDKIRAKTQNMEEMNITNEIDEDDIIYTSEDDS